ncbi:MAG: hypothetical protein ACYDH5_11405 [Acidimicrobiales bacterium]
MEVDRNANLWAWWGVPGPGAFQGEANHAGTTPMAEGDFWAWRDTIYKLAGALHPDDYRGAGAAGDAMATARPG